VGATRSSRRFGGHKRTIVAALVALALVAAACGDDDDTDAGSEGAGDGGPATSAELPPGTPVRIGVLIDQSGPQSATNTGVTEVLEAWANHTNANGGVADRPVELVVEDSRGDAPTATSAVQGFIDDASVDAMVIFDPSTEAAVGETVSEARLPVVGGVGYLPTVWGALPNWFGITTTFPSVVNEQVISAQEQGAQVLASAPCAEVPSCAAAEPIFEGTADALGLDYVGAVEVAADAPNYTAECLEFVDRGAEFVQISANETVGTRLAADCVSQGYDGWFGASAGSVTPGLYSEVDRLTGGLNAFPWYADAEPVQNYRDVMDDQGVSEDQYGTPISTAAWATMELFKKTIEANADAVSEDLTRDEVITAYGTVKDETLDGLLPNPITFTADQPASPVDCFWLYTAEGGEITGAFEPTCPPSELSG
jgi:branched-chain amino acid transport system substrate-binding protein